MDKENIKKKEIEAKKLRKDKKEQAKKGNKKISET
jgi:hypothetical protein